MAYLVKINNKEQYKFALQQIENWHARIHGNVAGYIEYVDIIDELLASFRSPEIVDLPAVEVTSEVVPPRPVKEKVDLRLALCGEHPTYQAKRSPRTDCPTCWEHYKKLNPTRYDQARRKFERQ